MEIVGVYVVMTWNDLQEIDDFWRRRREKIGFNEMYTEKIDDF